MPGHPQSMKKLLNSNPFKKSTSNGTAVYGVSSYSAFFPPDKFLFKVEAGNASKELKEKNFFEAFKTIITNKDLVPDHTLILLNQDKHHRTRSKKKKPSSSLTSSNKKLKCVAGTRPITEYFPLKKSNNNKNNKKVTQEPHFDFLAEEILYKLRGDKVKILWIPENHSELDPIKYVTTVLKSEICNFMENNPGSVLHKESESKEDAIKHNIEIFPDLVWTHINERVQQFEKIYLERNEDVEFDQDEEDDADDEEECDDQNSN